MKKLSFLVLWGILGLTLPTSAQQFNPKAASKALAAKNSIQQALIKEIAGTTKPAMYIFPMREALPSTGNRAPIGSFIPDRADLIPGSTFRPRSGSLRNPTPAKTIFGAEMLGNNILQKLQSVTYTGTVFKDGDDIFGLVPTHILRWEPNNPLDELFAIGSLRREFELEVYNERGSSTILWGKVVQLGAMLDVSLVKFHTKDEKLLSPLSLRTKEITAATHLHVQGFNNYEPLLMHVAGLSVFRTTPTFMQVRLPGSINQHAGLCGSPALDEEGRLAGIFVGSRSSESPSELGTGYLTPLSSVKTVLEAYRNGGKATFPLKLNGQTVAHVGADEWVKQVYLFGTDGTVVWSSGPMKKFSYSQVEEKIKELSAAYIGLDIFQIHWSASGELVGKPLKRVVYNLAAQHPESEGLYKE